MFQDADFDVRPESECWTTIPIPRGTEFRGVLAGPVRTVWMHHDGTASKPCRAAITQGQVPCYCERDNVKARVYGYAPFCCRDGQQVVIMVSKTTARKMKGFTHGTPVKLVRPDREKAALVPHSLLAEEMGTKLVERIRANKPACIAAYLICTLWHDDVLSRHFYGPTTGPKPRGKHHAKPSPQLDQTPPPKKPSDNALSMAKWLDGIGREVPN